MFGALVLNGWNPQGGIQNLMEILTAKGKICVLKNCCDYSDELETSRY